VARLAAALGNTIADLLPTSAPPDDLAVMREQAHRLFKGLIESDDRQTLALVVQLLARLSETDR
jgi:hypothetical protein